MCCPGQLGVALIQLQDLALGLLEMHQECTSPPLKAIEIPLDALLSIEWSLSPRVHITNKDVKQLQPQY